MAGSETIYETLMRVKPDDLTPNAWAVKAGVGRAVWVELRKRDNPTRRTLEKLLGAIDMSVADFEARRSIVHTEVRGTGMSARDVQGEWRGPEQVKPLELLGSAFGGEFEDGVEMLELHLSEVLDYVSRPASVATDPEAYAVEFIGESMIPRYKPRERGIVSPKASVRIGDDVIVQLRGAGGDQLADRIVMVLVKELVKRGPTFIELRQYNPDKTFQVPIERVAAVHRIVTRLG